MKKFAITALTIALLTPMASMAGQTIDSKCAIQANAMLTYKELLQNFNTNDSSNKAIRALTPVEKVACYAVLEATFDKGLIGNRDKVQHMNIHLEQRKNKSWDYNAKVNVVDYKAKSGTYATSARKESIKGVFPLLPILPPTVTPPILGEPPRVN